MLKDIKHSIKHSFIYGLGNLATKIVGFILIPIFTNPEYLSISDYGVLSILDITSQLIAAIIGLALYQGLYRWYWDLKTEIEQKKLFYSLLIAVATISCIFSGILSVFSSCFSNLLFSSSIYSYTIILVVVNSGLLAIQSIPNAALRIQTKSILYTSLNVGRFVVILLLTIYFVVFLKRGVSGIFEAQLIGNIFYFFLCSKFILSNIYPVFQTKIVKDILQYSYPLIIASISGIILSTIDRFSLNYLADLPDVAIYSLGFKMANTIKVFIVASVQMALSPLMLKKINDEDNKRFYSKVLTYFSFCLMIIVLLFSMFSKELIQLLAVDKQFLGAIWIVPIISLVAFFGMMKDTTLIGLQVKKKTKVIGSIIAIMAIVNLGFNILLIPYWGIYGAAFATLISQILFFILIYLFAQKTYFIPYEIIKILKILLVASCLFALSLVSNNWHWYFSIIYKLFLICSFSIILYYLNFFEPIEETTIKKTIKKILFNTTS